MNIVSAMEGQDETALSVLQHVLQSSVVVPGKQSRHMPISRQHPDALLCSLRQYYHHDTTIGWVRGHIGIEGNTIADQEASLRSLQGRLSHTPHTVTHAGLRAHSKQLRKEARRSPSFGSHIDWHRTAFTAFTWMRTNRGPMNSWLHHIKASHSPQCPCGDPREDGHHVVFACPLLAPQRQALLGPMTTWEDLDTPRYAKLEGEDDPIDAAEEFFTVIHSHFRARL